LPTAASPGQEEGSEERRGEKVKEKGKMARRRDPISERKKKNQKIKK